MGFENAITNQALADALDTAFPIGIKIDIVESGTSINTCKMLGMVPVSHEPADFNLYIRTVGSTVRVTRSDTDEVIVASVGFEKTMVALANRYNLPVEIVADPGVKVTAKMSAWIGTYVPAEPLDSRTLVTRETVTVGDLVTWQTVVGEDDEDMIVAEVTAITRVGLVLKDVKSGLRFKLGGGRYNDPEGLTADYWHGRVTVKYTPKPVRPVTDHDMRDQVTLVLGDEAKEADVPAIVDRLQSLHGTVDVATIPANEFWSVVSEVAWDESEAQIWQRTGTLIKPVRTKLAKRARKSARRARRGCKGGM